MQPMFTVVAVLLGAAGARARASRTRRTAGGSDLGATALEWAVISAIVVTAAVVIGGIIYNIVREKGATLQHCANQPAGSNGCP